MNRFLTWWTNFRCSWHYVTVFVIFCTVWLGINIFIKFDPDWSRLNLIISMLTELQSIILLIYTKSITDRNSNKDILESQRIDNINNKLDILMKEVYHISDDVDKVLEDDK